MAILDLCFFPSSPELWLCCILCRKLFLRARGYINFLQIKQKRYAELYLTGKEIGLGGSVKVRR